MTDHIRAAREARADAWRAQGLWTGESLPAMLARGVAEAPDTQIVFASAERPSTVTIAELWANSARVAAGLHAIGLRAGDIIVSQTPHWREGVELLLASLRLGTVIVPVVHIYNAAELAFILMQTRAKALVMPDAWINIDYRERLTWLRSPDLAHVITIGTTPLSDSALLWADLLNHGDALPDLAPVPEQICAINFTSGTTSAPKGVMHSHRTLGAEVVQGVMHVDAAIGGALITSPAGHIGGFSASLRPFLLHENAVFLDRWNLDRALDAIVTHNAVRLICTPFHINAILGSGRTPPNLKHLMVGGAGVSPSLVETIEQHGVAAYRCWGCTEHPTVTSSGPADPLDQRAFTDGPVMLGCEVRIVDDEERPVPNGERGEIHSIGPELFEGYLDASLNEAAFTADGWYRTGDIGIVDERGCLTIVDRKKDIIIRGGENISSKEVEDVLVRHPAIAEAAAVGWPDVAYGEKVAAFIIAHDRAAVTIGEVLAHFDRCGIARQKTPEHLVFVEELPRNLSGKVLKQELRARARALAQEQAA